MMEPSTDLHIHTTYSDGEIAPEEVLSRLQYIGASACAITDHDTIEGCKVALELQAKYGIEVIPGVELSAHEDGVEYHILGYEFDIDNCNLLEFMEVCRINRLTRAKEIVKKLAERDVILDFDEIVELAGKSPITRPHIAHSMLNHEYVDSIKEAFTLYIGTGCSAYVPKVNFPVSQAIKLIRQAHGISSLAHPGKTISLPVIEKIIGYGLDAIEIIHPSHNPKMVNHYRKVAQKFDLIPTGGSDFHGNRGYDANFLGQFMIPYDSVKQIKKKCEKYEKVFASVEEIA